MFKLNIGKIGVNSVVLSDIPANAILVGAHAKIIKMIENNEYWPYLSR